MDASRVNEPATEITAGRTAPSVSSAAALGASAAVQLTSDRALQLQRAIGNRALARMIAHERVIQRDAAGPVAAPVASHAVDQRDALVSLDGTPAGSLWTQLNWKDVSAGAADRISKPSGVNQGDLGLCGPAAILNWLIETDPVTYAQKVRTVFSLGGIHGMTCNTELLDNTCDPQLTPVDWMMLSAMQDLSNNVLEYHGRPTGNSHLSKSYYTDGTIDRDAAWMMKGSPRFRTPHRSVAVSTARKRRPNRCPSCWPSTATRSASS